MPAMRADPARLAASLVAELKGGNLSRLDRATVERACDIHLREHGPLSPDGRMRLYEATALEVFNQLRASTCARRA
jgi:hypothetical protein